MQTVDSLLTLCHVSPNTVYFDMEVGGEEVGRITFELRADVAPKTAGDQINLLDLFISDGSCHADTSQRTSGRFVRERKDMDTRAAPSTE